MVTSDFHMHTDFSTDSKASAEKQILSAISRQLTHICITDHEDYGYPTGNFHLNLPEYTRKIKELQTTFSDQIRIELGIEAGLRPDYQTEISSILNSYPFDFIIGSSHVVQGKDPYNADFWEGIQEKEGIILYLEETLKNIELFDNFDVYGHIDYIIRYVPSGQRFYSYSDYSDLLDAILKTLIQKGKGIECNTGGFKYGLGHPNPHEDLLKRYVQLGGEILTIGSDAHAPEHVAYDFQKLPDLLLSCGFKYYTTFHERKPQFHRL